MNYYLTNYQEIHGILEKQNGVIESKYVADILYAFGVASGQGYFRSRTQAMIDYLNTNAFLIVEFPDRKVEVRTLNELEKCFQTFDRWFKLDLPLK